MARIIGSNIFKRRGLELHIAKLFELRREHGDASFFESNGTIRPYARDYLRTWIPVWESDEARQAAYEKFNAMLKDVLGSCIACDPCDDPEELMFREVLGILQEDYPRYYLEDTLGAYSEAQMDELLDVYSLSEEPWQRTLEDKDAFDNVLFFNRNI